VSSIRERRSPQQQLSETTAQKKTYFYQIAETSHKAEVAL
jgi:hypothetical protein